MDNVTRWNFRVLGKALKTRRVVIISGARQCGKSTLLEMFFDGKVEIRSLDSKRLREAALLDPQSFVHYDCDGPMVIDEVQKAPELLSEIKLVVDRNRRPGQYVITGSSDIYSAPETDESLAGRVKNIRMRTFAQGEIQGVEPTFLDRLFANDYDSLYPDCDKRTVLDLAFRGGYPEVVRLSPEDRREWFQDYVKSLFSKDIKDDERIRQVIVDFHPRLVVLDPIQAYIGNDADLHTATRSVIISSTKVSHMTLSRKHITVLRKTWEILRH